MPKYRFPLIRFYPYTEKAGRRKSVFWQTLLGNTDRNFQKISQCFPMSVLFNIQDCVSRVDTRHKLNFHSMFNLDHVSCVPFLQLAHNSQPLKLKHDLFLQEKSRAYLILFTVSKVLKTEVYTTKWKIQERLTRYVFV